MSFIEGACDLTEIVPPKEKDGASQAKYATMGICLMSGRSMLFFFGGSSLVGRTFTIGTPSVRPFSIYGWSDGQVYIACVRPTNRRT